MDRLYIYTHKKFVIEYNEDRVISQRGWEIAPPRRLKGECDLIRLYQLWCNTAIRSNWIPDNKTCSWISHTPLNGNLPLLHSRTDSKDCLRRISLDTRCIGCLSAARSWWYSSWLVSFLSFCCVQSSGTMHDMVEKRIFLTLQVLPTTRKKEGKVPNNFFIYDRTGTLAMSTVGSKFTATYSASLLDSC